MPGDPLAAPKPRYQPLGGGPTPGEALSRYSSLKQGVVQRPNPLGGTDQILGPDSQEYRQFRRALPTAMAATNIGADGSTYAPQWADDPATRSHEMVHIGQGRLDNSSQLPSAARVAALGVGSHPSTVARSERAIEQPAYALTDPLDNKDTAAAAAKLGAYTNMLNQQGANPYATASIQSALPNDVIRRMLMNYPPSPVAPIPPGLR